MRTLLFDPTVDGFAERWRRYDWRLLRSGHVFRYDDAGTLRVAGARLASLGYLLHRTDAASWHRAADVHAGLAAALSFPDHYGHNLDALRDSLLDVARYDYGADPATTGTALTIAGYRRVTEHDARFAGQVLDCFAEASRFGLLLGHPMLCLVEYDGELGAVGAQPVLREPAP